MVNLKKGKIMNKVKKSTENLLMNTLIPKSEYPFEVPENWIYFSFTSLLDVQGGTQPPKSQFINEKRDGYIRLVQIRDFASDKYITFVPDTKKLRKIKKDDIVIARYGASVGRILTGLMGAYNVALAKVIYPQSLISKDYLFWLLKSEHFQAPLMQISRSAQSGFNKKDLSYFKMPLPPLNEQKRIFEKIERLLNRLDEAKQLIEKVKESYELRRTAIFDKAFRGELTKEWRTVRSESNTDKTNHIAELKNSTKLNRDSELKEPYSLPKGWIWVRIGDLFHVQIGSTPSRKNENYWNGENAWISSGEVQFNCINKSRECVTDLAVQEKRLKLAPKGSVLFGMIGEGKTRGQVALLDIDAYHNQNVASIWVSQTKINSTYVLYWLMSRYMENRQNSAGNNQPAYNKSRVQDLLIPIAPIGEINEIAKRLESLIHLEEKINKLLSLEEKIGLIKQSILSKAFRGELGTNDPTEESAIELIKEVLQEQVK